MAYKKILVDNLVCSRRFHIAYNEQDKLEEKVSASCPYCGVNVFKASQHPKVTMIRDEIIISNRELSPKRTSQCHLKDHFSPPSKPK